MTFSHRISGDRNVPLRIGLGRHQKRRRWWAMEQRNSTTERSNKKPVEGDRPRPSRRLAAHESGGRAGRDGRRQAKTSCRSGNRLKRDLEAELLELGDETLGFDGGRAAVEMVGAKVLMYGAVLQHVVDRGQHRSGDGANGFLFTAFGAQPVELRLAVAVPLAAGRPGAWA